MKKIKFIILSTFLLFGLGSVAQTLEIPPNLSKGDSLKVIMKSGIYNYGILSQKSDTSLTLFIDNQRMATTLYHNRIAEVYVLTPPKPIYVQQTAPSQNSTEPTERIRYGRGSSVASLRVGDEVELKVRNGNTYKGIIDRNMVMRIDLRTTDNKILAIPKDDIVYLWIAREDKNDSRIIYEEKNLKENAEAFSRYFFAPSAIKHKAGTFVYDNSYAFINSLSYSVTNFASVTAGGEFISALMGEPIVMLSPHVGFKVADNLHLGGGFVHLNRLGVENRTLNAFFGTATLGNNKKNVSINFGKGMDANSSYTLNVSGYVKIKNNFALITESWFFPDNQFFNSEFPFIALGGRVFGPEINFDFGLVNLVVPYLGFSYKFN